MDITPQVHKAHAGAGSRGGKAKKARELAAKRNNGAQQGYSNWRAFIGSTTQSSRMVLQKRADRMQRGLHMPKVNRQSDTSPAPTVVAVAGPPSVGKSTLVRDLARYYTGQHVREPIGPLTIVTNRKRRVTVIEVENDLASMIDAAKIADIVVLVVDSSFGLEMETFEFLNVLYTHGMPRVCAALTHLDGFGSVSQLRSARRRLKHRFETAINKGCKLFMLEWDGERSYRRNDVHQMARYLSDAGARDTNWRKEHAHILTDRFEDLTPAEDVRAAPGTDRRVALYGYLRGARLVAGEDTRQKFHLPGVGDFTATSVKAMPDPAPLPCTASSGAAANARDRVLFAPMSHVGSVRIATGGDGTETYITLGDRSAVYSRSTAERAGIELTEGERMLSELQVGTATAAAGAGAAAPEDVVAVAAVRGAGATVGGRAATNAGKRRRVDFGDNLDELDEAGLDAAGVAGLDVADDDGEYEYEYESETDEGAKPAAHTRRGALDERTRMRMAHGAKKRGQKFNEGAWLGAGDAEDDVGGGEGGLVFAADDDADGLGLSALMALERGEDVVDLADVPAEAAAQADLAGLMGEDAAAESDGDAYDYEYYSSEQEEEREAAPAPAAAAAAETDGTRLAAADVAMQKRLENVPLQMMIYGTGNSAADEEDADPLRGMPALMRVLADVDADDEFRVIPTLHEVEDYEILCEGRWAVRETGSRAARDVAEAAESEAQAQAQPDQANADYDRVAAAAAGRLGLSATLAQAEAEAKADAAAAGRATVGLAQELHQRDVADAAGDGSALDLERDRVALVEARNKAVDAALGDRLRGAVGGLPTGTYVRIEFEAVPAELCAFFDGRYPLIAGAVNAGEDRDGLVHCRVKRHRWHRKILKSFNPLIVSVGWRRYETAPIYSIQDQNGRRRLLKYTPEHMHCLATFRGPTAPAQAGVCAFQTVQPTTAGFRVAAAGVVLETLAESPVVKKLKLTGTPMRIETRTAFIKDMFTTAKEATRFAGAKIRTVSGIRGVVKRAVREPAGVVRCTFEDKPVLSDIVFLRAWFPVAPRPYCVPVDNLLMPAEERKAGWARGARTVGRLRQDLQVPLAVNIDNVYRPIERPVRRAPKFKVPLTLQKSLPYSHKVKQGLSKRTRKAYVEARKVTATKAERRDSSFLRQVSTAANERVKRERTAARAADRRARKEARAEDEARRERRNVTKANMYAAQARIDAEIRRRHV